MKRIVYICLVLLCVVLAGCTAADEPLTTSEKATETEAVTIETAKTSAIVETDTQTTSKPVTTAVTTAETTTAETMALPDPLGWKELEKRAKEAKKNGTLTIVVDPGHGIADPGAMHDENLGTVTEASLTLAISKELKAALETLGFKVIMTHDGVTKPDTEWDDGKAVFGPSERCSFSNAQEAHLFISIHCDSYPNSSEASGVRIYYPVSTPFSTKLDKQYAKVLAKSIEGAFPNDKDVLLMDMHGQDCYTVLYKTLVPSVLVECGFITNKDDAEKLLNAEWRTAFANALANGINEYFN